MEILNLAQLARPFAGASLDLPTPSTNVVNAGFERAFDNFGKVQESLDAQKRAKKKSDFAKKLEEQFGRASGLGDMERMVLANKSGYDPEGAAKDFMDIVERREKAEIEFQKQKDLEDDLKAAQQWSLIQDQAAEEYQKAPTAEAKAVARAKYDAAFGRQQDIIAKNFAKRSPEQVKLFGSPISAPEKFAQIELNTQKAQEAQAEKLAEEQRRQAEEQRKQAEEQRRQAESKRQEEELRIAKERLKLDDKKLDLERKKADAAIAKQNAELAQIEKNAETSTKQIGTQSERIAAGYYRVLKTAEERIKQPTAEDFLKYKVGIVTPTMQTQLDWLNAFLRKTSGAAITKEDIELERKALMPDVKDSKETIANKKKARETRMEGIKTEAGVAIKSVIKDKPKTNIKPKSDPLNLY